MITYNNSQTIYTKCNTLKDVCDDHVTVRFCNEFELDPSKIYFD